MALVQSNKRTSKRPNTQSPAISKDIHEGAKVYIYTRVSTAMQVDGYSLEAQEEEIRRYVDRYSMQVAGRYTDKGFSGKNISGRLAFQEMLDDIEDKKDNVRFVIVFKLSRFGRNAADVLSTLRFMQQRGVDLICVKDGIDSSTEQSKLFISVMAAMAEIERENILVQTMSGRLQKAREGGWNGGFAPYGYNLQADGSLVIEEDEAATIRLIYDKFVHTTLGMNGVASWLNEQGYTKKIRQNGTLASFSSGFVRGVLDNPIYMGKIAFGRRTTVPKEDNPDEYHTVLADQYHMYDGQHEAIISEELWKLAQEKRTATGHRYEKLEKEHEYLLSGLLKCPGCGAPMYGIPSRKKRKDGTPYPTSYSYICRNNSRASGHKCAWKKQVACKRIDASVVNIIKSLTAEKAFSEAMKDLIGDQLDVSELQKALETAQKSYRQAVSLQRKLEQQLDALDPESRQYERMYESLNRRLYDAFDSIDAAAGRVQDAEEKLNSVKQEQLSRDSVYEYLMIFGEIYDKMSAKEQQSLMRSMISSIDIYPEKQANGQQVKTIHFRFPVSYKGTITSDIFLPFENHDECVVLMSRVEK